MAKKPSTDSAVESETVPVEAESLEQPVTVPAESETVPEEAAQLEHPVIVPVESETVPEEAAQLEQPVTVPVESEAVPESAAPQARPVLVRLLVDSEYGPINAVVYLPEPQAASAVKAGLADDHHQAVASALSQTIGWS